MAYRAFRNIEASIIDKLKANLAVDWSDVNIEKTFARIYNLSLPSICVRCGTTSHDKAELGSSATIRKTQVLIDVFATSDGLKLDLLDYLVDKIKAGFPYYEYAIANGAVQTKTLNGRIRVLDIDVTHVNFDQDRDKLDLHDKYRGLITLNIGLGRLES